MYRLTVKTVVSALLLGATGVAAADTPVIAPVLEIPNQFIVEYAKGTPVARQVSSDATFKVLKTFDSRLFSGAAVEVAEGSDGFGILGAAPHIVNIWPNRRVALDSPVSQQVVDSGSNAEDDGDVQAYSTHRATGVGRLHAQGVLGQGVKVAIIDTGVWYLHPALGGGFGPGFKVAGGWDLVGEADTPNGADRKPDADPISLPSLGHGTHVAGIVAAAGPRMVGVAPNATLYAYKVTGTAQGSTDDATLIDAFLRAESDGVDVINASYGSTAGWSDAAWAVVVQRVVDAGVIVTVTAGNGGADGPFVGVSAGSAPGAVTVASVQAEVAPATPFRLTISSPSTAANTTRTVGYVGDDVLPVSIVGWPLVDMASTNPASAGDACEPYPAHARNLTGTIPLIRRGGCAWNVKQTNLLALGASVVLAYNDDRPIAAAGNTLPSGLIGCTTAQTGAAILKAIRQDNATVTVDFSDHGDGTVGLPDVSGNTPSPFSGWPATYDLQLRPDVAAPGGNILSTWSGPGDDGSNNQYALQSGTSMAAPYIAGVAALYVSLYGGRNGPRGTQVPVDFHRRVVASGMTLPWTNGAGNVSNIFSAPPAQMGSGLVDAWRTMYASSSVDVTRLNLNDTKHFVGQHEVTVTNAGTMPVTYNFTLEPAAGFEILDLDNKLWSTWSIKVFKDLVTIDLVPDVVLPETVTLAAGESRKVVVTFANPENKAWNATLMPLYSGKVKIAGSNGDRLSIGYLGLASDLYEVKRVFQKDWPTFRSSTWQDINLNATYNLNSSSPGFEYPVFFHMLDWGTHEMRWDIFESNWDESKWTYPPTAGSAGYIGAVSYWKLDWDQVSDPRDPAVVRKNIVDTPVMHLARSGFASRAQARWQWLGHLNTGVAGGEHKVLGVGNYTMRVAVARPFGDLSKVEGWEVVRHEINVIEST